MYGADIVVLGVACREEKGGGSAHEGEVPR